MARKEQSSVKSDKKSKGAFKKKHEQTQYQKERDAAKKRKKRSGRDSFA